MSAELSEIFNVILTSITGSYLLTIHLKYPKHFYLTNKIRTNWLFDCNSVQNTENFV